MRISDWSSGVCSSDLETSGSTVSAAAHLFWSVGCGREIRGGRAEAFPSGEPAMPVHRGQSSVPDDVVLRANGEAGDIVRAILGHDQDVVLAISTRPSPPFRHPPHRLHHDPHTALQLRHSTPPPFPAPSPPDVHPDTPDT